MERIHHNPEHITPCYESVTLELGASDIATAMELYLDFIELPREEREKIVYYDEARPRVGRSGYQHKGELAPDGQPLEDNKHLFHMTTDLAAEHIANRNSFNNLPAESRQFLCVAQEIYHSLANSAKQVFVRYQEEFPLLVGIHAPDDQPTQHHLRFLAYQTGKDGMLARGHYDKGTATIAVAESHNGLRLGQGPETLDLLERNQFDPVIFPGYGWHQLEQMLGITTSKKAAWHDVIDTGEQVSQEVIRWAMVYFIDPANLYFHSTQEQTHTPIDWTQQPLGQRTGFLLS